MSTPLDDYLKELTDQGTVDSQGVFTLDLAKAFEKLQRFRMARPSYYLLKFVQAAVAAGATRMDITVRADLVDLTFSLAGEQFDDVTATANLLQQPETAPHGPLRHLVLGLSSALAVPHQALLWSVVGPGQGQVLMVQGQSVKLSAPSRYPPSGKTRTCRFMLVRRAARMLVTADDSRAFVEERDIIKERCYCAPLALFLNGELLKPPAAGVDCLVEERVSAEGPALGWPKADMSRLKARKPGQWVSRKGLFRRPAWCRVYRQQGEDSQRLRSLMRLDVRLRPEGIFHLLVDGVMTGAHYIRDAFCESWVVAEGFKTDLSGLEVVEDQLFEQCKTSLRQRYQRLKLQAFAHATPKVREFMFDHFGRRAHPLVGKTMDDLLLIEPVEYGAFLAVDLKQEECFRVQILPVYEDIRPRLGREVQVWSRVAHPRVGKVRMGEIEGELCLATWPAVSLQTRLETPPLPRQQARAYLGQLCEGLTHLHQHNVVHGALSPTSLFLDEGEELTIGFPFERLNERIWRTGEGTFRAHYLTPEAIQGGPPRPCIDQYQAGLLAYRLLTGRLPFEGDDLMRVVFAHMTETPPDPREFAPDLTHMQVAAILRALEKEPDRRFPSIAEFASALLDG